MWKFVIVLAALSLGQVAEPPQPDPRVQAIAPFVGPDVLAVAHVDLAGRDVVALTARLAGERSTSLVADAAKALHTWSDRLRRAGAKDLFVVVNVGDLPGLPLVVVPLREETNAAEVERLFRGRDGDSPPVAFPDCATLRHAVVAGTREALDRARSLKPVGRPELAAALGAVGDPSIGLRLAFIPSPETRRVFEEIVPKFPPEVGGGPITDLTRGLLWAAAGLEGPRPSLRLVTASPNADAARTLRRLAPALVGLLERSTAFQGPSPGIPALVSRLETRVEADRIEVTADAEVAAGRIDCVLRPVLESRFRLECANHEKQIALAIFNYLDRHQRRFPPAFVAGKDGRPLLSWRVLILPYLDEEALYKEFHLDEPWDGPHNRSLIARMPQIYRCPAGSADFARDGKTRYLSPRGQGTVFRGAEPVDIKDVTDGASNTLILVDAGDERAVTWTKPDDWDVSADLQAEIKDVLTVHGGLRGRGTYAAFADGSVRFLHEDIKPATLRALLTYHGGESLSPEDR